MVVWQARNGHLSESFRVRERRMPPGAYIEGWTDRPRVDESLVGIWGHFCRWLAVGDGTDTSAAAYADRAWPDDPIELRHILTDCFLDLREILRAATVRSRHEDAR